MAKRLTAMEAIKLQLEHNQISEDQANRIQNITKATLALAKVILENSKPSPDQTAALRKLREAKYTLTNSIATEEFFS